VAGDPDIVSRSVYVSGLSYETTDQELLDHFVGVGPVVRAVVLRQRREGNAKSSMGCGVVEFSSSEVAIKAVAEMTDSELNGRKIRCREDRLPSADGGADVKSMEGDAPLASASASASLKAAAPPRKAAAGGGAIDEASRVPEPTKVFVTGLSWETTSEDLGHYFSSIGPVANTEVLTTRKGRSMGSGVVQFADESFVSAAVAQLGGKDFMGRRIGVRQYFQ
jgi:RNA recognition motif-containing protein